MKLVTVARGAAGEVRARREVCGTPPEGGDGDGGVPVMISPATVWDPSGVGWGASAQSPVCWDVSYFGCREL